ncbi:hypothetical protein JHU38_03585 [Prevotella sp. A2931]|uniref:Uncharacterized protein n=1 Tax=Prevotella illustrans TaxID=2800387 RepID=A0ABS3M3W1_9BACT|nr:MULTISPECIES: hypothetical protein [Prevotella]MBO1362865.1 hypothetical protein [Prevotella illustrans]
MRRDFHADDGLYKVKGKHISDKSLAAEHVLNKSTNLCTPAKVKMNKNENEKNAGASPGALITLTLPTRNKPSISFL